MTVISQTTYSNIPAYPKSWYWQNTNWSAKTVSVDADRYKLTSPAAIQVDVGGLSLTNEVAQELDLSLDATWDFGQSAVGTWTAEHPYSVGDWVRAATPRQSELTTPVWDRLQQVTGTPPSTVSQLACFYGSNMYILSATTVYVLNLVTLVWSTLSTTGTAPGSGYNYSPSIVAHNNCLYLFGGYFGGAKNETFKLDLSTLAWSIALTTSGTTPTGRYNHTAIVINDYMYIYGGQTAWNGEYAQDIYRLDLVTLTWDDAFTAGISGTPPLATFIIIGKSTYNNNLYMFQHPGDTFKLDLSTLEWSGALSVTGTKPLRSNATCGISNGYFYIFGGWGGPALNDVQRLNLTTLAWSGVLTCRGTTPCPRNKPTGGFYNGYLYTFGGGILDVHRLNTSNNIFSYKITSAGTSLSTEPTWGTTVDGTTAESGGPTWTCYYDDTVPTNRAGTDYFIYSCVGNSTTPVLLASRDSTYPHGYDATNSRKIGGFHCLCASAGTISSHPATGYLTGDIIPNSVWDLKKRCRNLGNNNNGMAYVAPYDDWWAIYLPSGTSSAPVSVYNAIILDTLDWNTAVDAGRAVGMRLPRDGEFQVAAALSNEQTNIYGSADPVTTGGHVDTAGRRMISRYFLEDCVGAMYQLLDEQSYRFDGATAHYHKATTITGDAETVTSGNAVAVDGSTAQDIAPTWAWLDLSLDKGKLNRQGTYGSVKLLAGGTWTTGAYAGSRYRALNNTIDAAANTMSFRLVCPSTTK